MNRILLILFSILVSCVSIHSQSTKKNNLKFDGVYIAIDGYTDTEGEKSMDCLIFYKNEKVLKQRAMISELSDMDKWYNFIINRNPKLFNYQLKKDSVHFIYSSGVIFTYYNCKIFNDSLNVTTIIDTGNKKITNTNTYHFRKLKSVKN